MSGYIVSPKADEDIFEVWRYLYSYLIVYRPQNPLEIARVLHGKRDLKKILEKSQE